MTIANNKLSRYRYPVANELSVFCSNQIALFIVPEKEKDFSFWSKIIFYDIMEVSAILFVRFVSNFGK